MEYVFFVLWIFLMAFATVKMIVAYYDLQKELKTLDTLMNEEEA